ncbi:E3 ubiquitin-protein ligase synoviolin-like [Lacerta agilis]|uniref:E3 ubiquitin-protein ligase synoviolin-like n=1 Tax=Lacerta agilis TaxID=80427 RepID=UPI0014195CB1|nr:E3 ubiquitin-protein ligase synoviolin-like [Lacerta agilis]
MSRLLLPPPPPPSSSCAWGGGRGGRGQQQQRWWRRRRRQRRGSGRHVGSPPPRLPKRRGPPCPARFDPVLRGRLPSPQAGLPPREPHSGRRRLGLRFPPLSRGEAAAAATRDAAAVPAACLPACLSPSGTCRCSSSAEREGRGRGKARPEAESRRGSAEEAAAAEGSAPSGKVLSWTRARILWGKRGLRRERSPPPPRHFLPPCQPRTRGSKAWMPTEMKAKESHQSDAKLRWVLLSFRNDQRLPDLKELSLFSWAHCIFMKAFRIKLQRTFVISTALAFKTTQAINSKTPVSSFLVTLGGLAQDTSKQKVRSKISLPAHHDLLCTLKV